MRRKVAAAALLVAACDSTGAYVYYARTYDQDRDCLGQTEALDIMAGDDPGLGCTRRCLTVNDPDAGTVLYGTTACGPVPYGVNATESDPRCVDVLVALASTRLCSADAGPKDAGNDVAVDAPIDASDAGPDATPDAAVDAAPEASVDATAD